ncbi:Uncharacterized protein FKW44_003639 [Caligus rogercresseyi]|uniref:Reverse transcriptase domain-containing protein n=1 Tax=Caligus rogercresseyi TaxID=217165 RepID=A0A7T8KLX5_CALRO|nr:Uncharacterized protein FKW44_003639 [Caligus rogercresseyi]
MSNVLPVFKGKGKSAADPASYRPVCILPALSKVLEIIVKSDLEEHLAKTEALPNTQFGFRKGRSTTAAMATHMQSGWRPSRGESEYGVRQGSILGPILYLVLVADVTSCVGIGNEDNSGYADDFFLWAVGDSLEGADAFSGIPHDRGQRQKKDVLGFTINVGAVEVHPLDEIEFLGVKFDTAFTTVPHNINIARQQQSGLHSSLGLLCITKRKIPTAAGQGINDWQNLLRCCSCDHSKT